MKMTKWLPLLVGVVCLNGLAVVGATSWRLATADEFDAAPQSLQSDAPTEDAVSQESEAEKAQDFAGADIASTDAPSLDLDVPATPDSRDQTTAPDDYPSLALPLPEAMELNLPEELSMAEIEAAKNSPLLRDIREAYENEVGSFGDHLLGETVVSGNYYQLLTVRLTTVKNLTISAQNIVTEASELSRKGENDRAREMLKMATQLREIAANLLVEEF